MKPSADLDPDDPELKASDTALCNNTTVDEPPQENKPAHLFDVSSVIDMDKFSCLRPLVRRTAWVLRAVNNLAAAVNRFHCKPCQEPEVTVEELNRAECHWVCKAQRDTYAKEIDIFVYLNQK